MPFIVLFNLFLNYKDRHNLFPPSGKVPRKGKSEIQRCLPKRKPTGMAGRFASKVKKDLSLTHRIGKGNKKKISFVAGEIMPRSAGFIILWKTHSMK